MTYPEDVLIAGREAVAVLEERKGYPKFASRVRRGGLDYLPQVQSACIAIMAERQRWQEWLNRKVDFQPRVEAKFYAILGQQETGNDRA